MSKILPFRPKGMPPLPPKKGALDDQFARCQQLCDEMRALITELEYLTEERLYESEETQDND